MKLRHRPRPDALVNQQRRATNSAGRMVYLGMLGILGLVIVNYLFGDLVFLRADGLVLRDRVAVATTYIARIDAIEVVAGQTVKAGDPVLVLQSTQMLEGLADLSSRRARLAAETADFHIRADVGAKLLPLAKRREREATRALGAFDKSSDRQLITNARYDEALQANFDARQNLVRLNAESETLKDELVALDAALIDAESALDDLRAHYADGIVRAPVSGDIGASIPVNGDVFRPGDTMLSIYAGDAFVLAYLPRNYLFSIHPGMEVSVTSGRVTAKGTVGEILPVAEALPEEFQNTFQPRDRSQLARIRFEEAPPFPVHEKVRLSRTLF